jgi:hypothetical protein
MSSSREIRPDKEGIKSLAFLMEGDRKPPLTSGADLIRWL